MAPKITTIIIILLLLIAGAAQHGPRGAVYVPGQTGYDVSWPNCHVSPPKQAPFGIIGVTYGKNYTKAPCLAQQATWFAHYDAYMNTGNVAYDTSHRSYTTPIKCTGRDETCAAYNYGYAAALYALKYANSQHVYPATWWLDVETENTWSSNTNQNRAALAGAVVAITHAAQAVQVGFYAIQASGSKLQPVGGHITLPGLPRVAAGLATHQQHAQQPALLLALYCLHNISKN
jgi:hypothetical protein